MSLLGRLVEKRAVTSWGPYRASDRAIPSNGEAGFSHTGEPINDDTALNVVSYYAAVRLLADTIASLPWHEYRKRNGVRELSDPQPQIITDPYIGETGDDTAFDWKHSVMVSLAMRGNFYGLITRRDRLEFATEIMPLHPDWVHKRYDRRRGRVVVTVQGEEVPAADVFHIKGFTPPGALEGLSPIGLARHSIGLGLAAQRFGGQWFRDGAAPSGQIITDQPMDPDQVKQAQQQWIATHGGRRLPAVMSGGLRYEPISITPEDSQFLQTRQFTVTEMAMLVGVPPYLLGDVEKSTSFGRGIEQQSIGFVTYNLRSWLTRVEARVTRERPRGRFVRFTVEGLLRGDTLSRYQAHKIAIEAGFKNRNEVRGHEDLPPIPGPFGEQFDQTVQSSPGTGPIAQGDNDDG